MTGTGSWDVTDNGSPHAGVYHLRAEQGEDGTSSQQAVFAVDLSGQAADAEIYLDYWAGNSRSTVLINGATTATAVDGSQSTNLGGLLALPSNIGTFQQDEFAVIPEFGVRLSYSVCRNLTASAGYTFLYWSRLLRSSEQIDTNIDVSQLPPAIPAGAVRPEFRPVYSDFWAQGLTFGLEYRF